MVTVSSATALPTDHNPAIRIDGLIKHFGPVEILQNIQCSVLEGSCAGLIGINGAGKTTLLKCLLDFCHFEAGRIEIFGTPSRNYRARARITFLPERFVPPYYLSGKEFLELVHSMAGRPFSPERAAPILDALRLPIDALSKPSGALSKGMTQKLGLASCLLSDRDLYILDEPMSGLDPQARAQVKELFAALKKRGKTLLFTSHSLADIGEICDHMIVLHQGSIAFSGTPANFCGGPGEISLEQAFLRCIEPDG